MPRNMDASYRARVKAELADHGGFFVGESIVRSDCAAIESGTLR